MRWYGIEMVLHLRQNGEMVLQLRQKDETRRKTMAHPLKRVVKLTRGKMKKY
jgi:hypothetical protein